MAAVELRPLLHCVPRIEKPTSIVFDLDPGEGTDILQCAEVAFQGATPEDMKKLRWSRPELVAVIAFN